MSLLPWLLFLHIIGAVIAFGPGFALAIFGAAAGRAEGPGTAGRGAAGRGGAGGPVNPVAAAEIRALLRDAALKK